MTRAESIASGLNEVRARIAAAEQAAARAPGSVRLLAVSKRMPPEDIEAARRCGQEAFAESYAQELRDKRARLGGLPATGPAGIGLRWHYIGPLQSNKIKYLAGQVDLIHSVDSAIVVGELERRLAVAASASPATGEARPPEAARAQGRSIVQRCLVQVNVADEPQKAGIDAGGLAALLDAFASCAHVACVGLMAIPPMSGASGEARRHFAALRALAERERRVARPQVELCELSMGMSHDFCEAIAEGATLVRVGTAIFGDRAPRPEPQRQ